VGEQFDWSLTRKTFSGQVLVVANGASWYANLFAATRP
jgi:hypothetical protein